MYELVENAKRLLRGGAALALAFLLCAGPMAGAAEVIPGGADPSARMLIPVGHTVGIKLFSRGVLVVKLSDGGTPAKECGLKTGDVIVKCGGVTVSSTEQFQSLLQKGGETVTNLQVRRGSENMTLSVEPEQNEQGTYSIGAWIRDSMAGIGTMTYYDPATGAFGALGHGITDTDTALLMPFASGSILPSTVKAVKKGAAGEAGELRGDFDLTTDLGSLNANTANGIFGSLPGDTETWQSGVALPVASAGEVKEGPATILSNVEGDTVQSYDVEILKVLPDAADSRNMVISVTDPDLIAATGGIVQGMSGSPILQNGKLVGAVTHVLLNDPTKGYGIFIENMLSAAN
ncbi:SpoIVB peptidase [Oscillibacter sp.]|uniref:SpoIVB peptidase n=1 Tax=Oscillibacter sp. TaxID=1945593 RepID=UPI002608759D|nr:SpoIVB peptidase [Oscillibacter sp.]MDD3346632.1 SpoIVB peptidase [Oscillibacter sp.]